MIRVSILKWVEALAYRWSRRRQISGVRVSFLFAGEADWRAVEPRLTEALDLIAEYAPIRFRSLQADVEGIWILGEVGPLGVWLYRLRVIRLRETYCRDPQVSAAHLACTIVHEATHAFLWRLGFRYPEHQRVQIERVCMRSERVFLQRVPGEDALLERMRSARYPTAERYTDEAFQRSGLQQLRELETPAWAMRLLGAHSKPNAGEPSAAPDAPRR